MAGSEKKEDQKRSHGVFPLLAARHGRERAFPLLSEGCAKASRQVRLLEGEPHEEAVLPLWLRGLGRGLLGVPLQISLDQLRPLPIVLQGREGQTTWRTQ